jgi:acyl dehydratase
VGDAPDPTGVRYFEEFELGETYRTPGRTLTEADLARYAAISGDHDALDLTGVEPDLPPRVPDLMVMVLSSGLGFRVPVGQPRILAFMVLELEAREPVRVGDTLHCRVRIEGKRAMREAGVLIEKREMVNQRGEVVQEAEYKLLVARRPAA